MTDASLVGLGAGLLQKKNGEPRIICYVSHSLTPVERRYSQTEKEALALVFTVERLKYYLLGREFDLIMDHEALETILGPKSKPCARLEWWMLRLQTFKNRVRYVPRKNNLADPLSRLLQVNNSKPVVNSIYKKSLVSSISKLAPNTVLLHDIRQATQSDPELSDIYTKLQTDSRIETKPYNALMSELCVVDGILLHGNRCRSLFLTTKCVRKCT